MNLITPLRATYTVAAGTASNTVVTDYHLCKNISIKQIFVQPKTSTTTFDFKLTDVHGDDTWVTNDNVGEYNEITDIPVYGNLTATISGSSVNETFIVNLVVEKKYD